MWVPKAVAEWFQISKQAVDELRTDLAVVRAERDFYKTQALASQANFDWARVRVNTLELERAALIEKAYGLKVPVPEITRAPVTKEDLNQFSFDDMGDDAAKRLGLPIYGN